MKYIISIISVLLFILIPSCDVSNPTPLDIRKGDPLYKQRIEQFGSNTPINFEIIIPEHRLIVRKDFINTGYFFFSGVDNRQTIIVHSLLDFEVTGHEYVHMVLYNYYGKEKYNDLINKGKLYK